MQFRFVWNRVAVVVAVLVALTLVGAASRAGTSAAPMKATVYGHFDYNQDVWVGTILISFRGEAPVAGTFKSVNTSISFKKGGAVEGTETMKVTLPAGTFDVESRFSGVPGSTPYLMNLHEVGVITNGTGLYANLSGSVSAQGPYINPFPPIPGGFPAGFIGELHGAVHGLP